MFLSPGPQQWQSVIQFFFGWDTDDRSAMVKYEVPQMKKHTQIRPSIVHT